MHTVRCEVYCRPQILIISSKSLGVCVSLKHLVQAVVSANSKSAGIDHSQ
jgi:hypothetical protein